MGAKPSVVCIGAGPAGLTAAYLLTRDGGADVVVLERDPVHVGGISRTETYKGFGFDIGGHRFFSKSREVEELWTEMLGDGFLDRPRKSRIHYNNRLFDYPLRALDALTKLGVFEATRCVLSYARACVVPKRTPRNFEEWVVGRFGRRLFEIFFRTYTEKVWGMKCRDISADWAAQRIKGLSLWTAIWHALRPQRSGRARGEIIKTLVDSFRYPARGPGMLWEAAAAKIAAAGGRIVMDRGVVGLERRRDGRWIVSARDRDGVTHIHECDHVISSMPMQAVAEVVSPQLPASVRVAAEGLRYRDFLVVSLIIKDRGQFDDNWIYIHSPDVRVGRIQNFKSWSPEMVPDEKLNCYGMEYFCFEGDGLWNSSNDELTALATGELIALGLAVAEDIVEGTVVRQPKAYPVYDDGYQARVAHIRDALDLRCPNLHLVGRNGMHMYNNQDHAMMTAMLTVRNILAGRAIFDVWQVNQDAEYHEAGVAGADGGEEPGHRAALGGLRMVPAAAR